MNLNQVYTRLENIQKKIEENAALANSLDFYVEGKKAPEVSFEDLQGEYLELSKERTHLLVLAEKALLTNLVDIEDANNEEVSKRVTLKEVKLTIDANSTYLSRLKNARQRYYRLYRVENNSANEIPNFDPETLLESINAVEDRIEYLTNVFQMASVQIDTGE